MRNKNVNWDLPETLSWSVVPVAVLMDIRDELQTLTRLLNCPRFLTLPETLSAIRRNTRIQKQSRKTTRRTGQR